VIIVQYFRQSPIIARLDFKPIIIIDLIIITIAVIITHFIVIANLKVIITVSGSSWTIDSAFGRSASIATC